MTIVPKKWNMYKPISLEKYQRQFNTLFPEIGQVLSNLNNSNVYVMGGACVNTLNNINNRQNPFKTSDIDFFIVGDYTEDEYFEIVSSIITELQNQLPDIKCDEKVITGLIELLFITDEVPHIKIQIVLRHFPTIEDLLYNVDVPSTAIAYNGDNLLMSYMGAFSQLFNVNIIHTPNYSANFSKRLLKYYKRGYGMCFPFLKKDIPKKFILDKMKFNIENVIGSYIYPKNIKLVADYGIKTENEYTDDNNYNIINAINMEFGIKQLTKSRGIKRWFLKSIMLYLLNFININLGNFSIKMI